MNAQQVRDQYYHKGAKCNNADSIHWVRPEHRGDVLEARGRSRPGQDAEQLFCVMNRLLTLDQLVKVRILLRQLPKSPILRGFFYFTLSSQPS